MLMQINTIAIYLLRTWYSRAQFIKMTRFSRELHSAHAKYQMRCLHANFSSLQIAGTTRQSRINVTKLVIPSLEHKDRLVPGSKLCTMVSEFPSDQSDFNSISSHVNNVIMMDASGVEIVNLENDIIGGGLFSSRRRAVDEVVVNRNRSHKHH